jgi:uncharacterized membrane protein
VGNPNRVVLVGVVAAVLTIWLVGAAVTKYSLEQMAFFAPLAVCVIGATAAIVLLWIKVVVQLRRERRGEDASRTGIRQKRNPAA